MTARPEGSAKTPVPTIDLIRLNVAEETLWPFPSSSVAVDFSDAAD